MSYTLLFRIEKDGNLYEDLNIENARGMQPLIWSVISKKIFGDPNLWIVSRNNAQQVWEYWKDPECTENEAFAILCTFDKAVIEGNLFREAALKLKDFFHEHSVPNTEANAFPDIIKYLEKNAENGQYGICFHHNSLSPCPWGKSYNFIRDTEHFGVFASLKTRKDLVPPDKFNQKKFTKKEEQNESS